jgi:ribosome maturation factor RimP
MVKASVALIEKIITPAVNALGYELVACELRPGDRRLILRVYIDSENGVNLDDCTKISRQISALLDVEYPALEHYDLEVSSPGLDRPLVKPAHYQRYIGKRIRVKLRIPYEDRRNFTGELLHGDADTIAIRVDNQTFCLNLADIEKANLIPDY